MKGLRNLKMTEMELVRNDDLTFSALKLLVELPWVELAGKFRLYDKYKDFNICRYYSVRREMTKYYIS